MSQNKFYITTPIYYVNAEPHIGHAYTTVAADILARYHRLIGDRTFFLTGTDEHGANIEAMAKAVSMEPQEFVDGVADKFYHAWGLLGILNDRFIRTTERTHKKAVQNALQNMYDRGDIYKGNYESLYCRKCEQYKQEKDLVDGKCPDHLIEPEKMSEESYMFRLSKYQDILLEKIKSDELKILPAEKKNEVVAFYENEKLQDISFSRKNVKWGIPIPWDTNHTVYVWADAFLNYLTGLNWNGLDVELPEMWPPDVQLMSKDILRVHATIWPAMLLSLNISLPKCLFVHGFFLMDGQKMSKSLGNVIIPGDLIQKYGADATRYLLMSAVVFGHDGDISWKKFDEKYNADLADGLGNLISRVTNIIEKNYDERIDYKPRRLADFFSLMDNLKFYEVLRGIMFNVAYANNLIEEKKLWQLVKDDKQEGKNVLSELLSLLSGIAEDLTPFMPIMSKKIMDILRAEKIIKAEILFPKIR